MVAGWRMKIWLICITPTFFMKHYNMSFMVNFVKLKFKTEMLYDSKRVIEVLLTLKTQWWMNFTSFRENWTSPEQLKLMFSLIVVGWRMKNLLIWITPTISRDEFLNQYIGLRKCNTSNCKFNSKFRSILKTSSARLHLMH